MRTYLPTELFDWKKFFRRIVAAHADITWATKRHYRKAGAFLRVLTSLKVYVYIIYNPSYFCPALMITPRYLLFQPMTIPSSRYEDKDALADQIYIITVLQSQYSQYGVNYTVRDNFLVAASDVADPKHGLIKRTHISRTQVFDQPELADEDALASVWSADIVPPLMMGLESLLMLGENATITLPLKCNAPKGYYKPPPPHLLRVLQENDSMRSRVSPRTVGPDLVIALPTSFSDTATAGMC